MKKILALAVSLLTVANAFAQTEVKGTVKDSNGEPILGATVVISGTSVGTMTGEGGRYSIKLTKPKSSLLFTCITMNMTRQSQNCQAIEYLP